LSAYEERFKGALVDIHFVVPHNTSKVSLRVLVYDLTNLISE
jgi:hypothetical protein